jgi:RimJ/RimL family protein N-acetyltransferase
MLKLSLGVRITNSVRVNLAKELARGVEVHRLLAAGLGAELADRFPGFAIVRDPAWLTLRTGRPGPESGFEVVLRENPYRAGDATDAAVVAALCHPGPDGGPSRLDVVVRGLAAAAGLPAGTVAREWFRRYLAVVADPLLWLYGRWGIALEAHQQNSVVELADGWPAGFRYRDNQGYYFKASAAGRLRRLLPDLNRASDTVCEDAVADERFGYYLAVNHLFGIVGTLGRDGVADEDDLLADLAGYLAATARDQVPVPPLVATLLGAPRLRVKANLRTRLDDLDELVEPLASQSVYVEVANPLAGRAGPAPVFETRLPGAGLASFRAMDPTADLDLVWGWMHQPHVVPYWRLDLPRAELGEYLRRAAADDHQTVLIGSLDGEPVSYWECYWAARDPLAAHYRAEPADQGVHLLIGPPERTGRGLDRRLLEAVVAWQLGREPATRRVVAEPDVRNLRMIHVFEQCGFRRAGELELPDKRAVLMVHERAPARP